MLLFDIKHIKNDIKKEVVFYKTTSISAEGGGFEPPVPLRVRQFSKLVVSATHPSFRERMLIRFSRCKDRKVF